MQAHYLEFLTVAFGVFLLMFEAFTDGKKSRIALIAAAGLTVILLLQCTAPLHAEVPSWMSRFYAYDALARFYKLIALVSTILVLLMAFDFRKILARFTCGDRSEESMGEFFCLPVFACAGLMWMASAKDLVSIFVALELVTITFYVLVAYMRRNVGSLEAGVKYLILGGLSTGFLVYGIAWVYGSLGTTDLALIPTALASQDLNLSFLLFGLALMIIALGFKIGAVPMQLWIPDVYQGAPTPITAYLSVASKAAGFIVMWKILNPFLEADAPTQAQVFLILSIMAGATLLYGNLGAIKQSNFKRLLGYSSIAHAGFLTIGIACYDITAVSFYLATYLVMTFSAFFILALVRNQEDSDAIEAFDGLGQRNPLLAAATTITMAAMAGIPLTAGFWGKFFIFKAALTAQPQAVSWCVITIAFICVAAGFYYYLKVVKAMYWNAARNEKALTIPSITKAVLITLTAAIVIIGIFPQPIICLLGQ
ncbi:NADH-quinone oxidoreductase subunit N [Verrucomicrobiaceae bacterium N1E253]|uniref:NADH-quinone oxidoreductase subunit N n=1 Tax=Oceaniferula marina TaxID=2748318 RepID=A0A851GEC7_9BACT|nr:NADH-quinone oxidoreductase subunit N [Oceaniferula marina]NWK54061.1 NADH-quinone oxidoreductase subunit N [Oceaniferula marina]